MINKLEKYLFYIFLFCIPFQTRIIFTQWTKPFNEWTATFFYLSDLLLIATLVLWLTRATSPDPALNPKNSHIMIYHRILGMAVWEWLLTAFVAISAVSIFNARFPGLAWYRLLKLVEFIALFLYVRSNRDKIFNYNSASAVIVGSGLFQAIIAIIQYFKQGSVGLKYLGESQIGPDLYNVAVFVTGNGIKYMRAYGTTPHPNVLAAFLVLALFTFYYWYSTRPRITLGFLRVILGGYAVILLGLFLTFSRTMIGIWGLAALALFIIVVGTLFSIFFWPQVKARVLISGGEEAVTQRIYYNEIAGKVTGSSPLFGVGIGQSVADLMSRYRNYPSYFYQPVHNIYLIISSETGLVGLGIFLIFIITLYYRGLTSIVDRQAVFTLFVFSFAFLLMGLFDHFFWTLQQGSFILWLILATLLIDYEGG